MKSKDLIKILQQYEDFDVEFFTTKEISLEELEGVSYPYPYEYVDCDIRLVDVGYSDNVLKLEVIER